uniref:Lipid-A-disaccharide synthase n=1 Tax=Chlorobium chlorochromatii (strain CaD3) TaxID=340177 RepID=Q3ATC7_CHLCH
MPKKLFVLAGEVSGDIHAAGVVAQLLQAHSNVTVFGVGGAHLKKLGATLLYDTAQMSIMGIVEVVKHAGFLRRVIRELKAAIEREKPFAALLVDYPGMNLHMAAFLHNLGIPVIYYVAPQAWAWKEGRVKTIRATVDRLLVIFDFEVEFFRRHGIQTEFVGHPVIEELAGLAVPSRQDILQRHALSPDTRLIGLLPGSRKQEIAYIFPAMLEAARKVSQTHKVAFLFGRAPNLKADHFRLLEEYGDLTIIECGAHGVMHASELLLVTSGTATFEALCFGAPMIVLYKTNALNYFIGKRLVKLHNISLANIVAEGLLSNSRTVPELLQDEATPEAIYQQVSTLLHDGKTLAAMRAKLLMARAKLASVEPSKRVAAVIAEYL